MTASPTGQSLFVWINQKSVVPARILIDASTILIRTKACGFYLYVIDVGVCLPAARG